jgi:hypothetical protein
MSHIKKVMPHINRKVVLVGVIALALSAAGGSLIAPTSSATTKPKAKTYNIKSTIAVVPLATEGNLVSMTVEGTLSSATPACTRNMEIGGSYTYANTSDAQRRNFGPVRSDAEGHWSAILSHVSPPAEREVSLYITRKWLSAHAVCGRGFAAEEHRYTLTF